MPNVPTIEVEARGSSWSVAGEIQGCVVLGDDDTTETLIIDVDGDVVRPRVLSNISALSVTWDVAENMVICARTPDSEHELFILDRASTQPRMLARYEDKRRSGALWAAAFGDGAFGELVAVWSAPRYPYPHELPTVPWRPLLLRNGQYVETDLPDVASSPFPDADYGIVRFAHSGDLLLWQGDAYEYVNGHFQPSYELNAEPTFGVWAAVPTADSTGFFYLSNSMLYEAGCGVRPRPHLDQQRFCNFISLTTGPDNSLLLREGENDEGRVATVYVPHKNLIIPIKAGFYAGAEIESLVWSPTGSHLVALAYDDGELTVVATPFASVKALPRETS